MLVVRVSLPIEVIGSVKCDCDGDYHIEVLGQEVDTDKDTYLRVSEARKQLVAKELGIEVD